MMDSDLIQTYLTFIIIFLLGFMMGAGLLMISVSVNGFDLTLMAIGFLLIFLLIMALVFVLLILERVE